MKELNDVQKTRIELTKIINEKVKPLRKKLDNFLNVEAEKICPFKLNEIITLDNGKKGQITEIKYFSLDYKLRENENYQNFYVVDEISYIYAYIVDDQEFSITWEISGLRMIDKGNKVGKIPFVIKPLHYNVDKINKKVTPKQLNDQTIDDFITIFPKLNND